MNTPRDHHFIPVFYLKQWAPAGRLIAYTRPHGEVFKKSVGPRATGYQRDLYSFNDLPDDVAQYLEAVFLSQNDFVASKALQKFLSNDRTPWTKDLRSSWSRFLLGFLMRHPDPFAELKAMARTNWLKPDPDTAAAYEKIRQPEMPATFEAYVQALGDGTVDKIGIRLLQGVMDNVPLGRRLNAMHWDTIDVSASDDALLTSDWPLDKNLPPKNGYVALPISPTRLFVGVYERWVLAELRKVPAKRLVHTSNTESVSRARRFVWAHDTKQTAFIKKHMSTRMVQPPFFPAVGKIGERTLSNAL